MLRNDQEVVFSAVAQNPKAFQYASSRLQDGGLASYVRDILAYDQFVFARRDELQILQVLLFAIRRILLVRDSCLHGYRVIDTQYTECATSNSLAWV